MKVLMEIYEDGYDTLIVEYEKDGETRRIMAKRNPYKTFQHPGRIRMRILGKTAEFERDLKRDEPLWDAVEDIKDTKLEK